MKFCFLSAVLVVSCLADPYRDVKSNSYGYNNARNYNSYNPKKDIGKHSHEPVYQDLLVLGDTELRGDVNIEHGATIKGLDATDLDVHNNAHIGGALIVEKDTFMNGDANVHGDLNVECNANVGKHLFVYGEPVGAIPYLFKESNSKSEVKRRSKVIPGLEYTFTPKENYVYRINCQSGFETKDEAIITLKDIAYKYVEVGIDVDGHEKIKARQALIQGPEFAIDARPKFRLSLGRSDGYTAHVSTEWIGDLGSREVTVSCTARRSRIERTIEFCKGFKCLRRKGAPQAANNLEGPGDDGKNNVNEEGDYVYSGQSSDSPQENSMEMLQQFNDADSNSDMKLDMTEFYQLMNDRGMDMIQMGTFFFSLDTDRDSFLTMDELVPTTAGAQQTTGQDNAQDLDVLKKKLCGSGGCFNDFAVKFSRHGKSLSILGFKKVDL